MALLTAGGCAKNQSTGLATPPGESNAPTHSNSPTPTTNKVAKLSELPVPPAPSEYACHFSAADFKMASVAGYRLAQSAQGDVEVWIAKNAKDEPAQVQYRNQGSVLWGEVQFELSPKDRHFLGKNVFHNAGKLVFTDLGNGKIQVTAALPPELSLARNSAVVTCDDLALRPWVKPPDAIGGGVDHEITAPDGSKTALELALQMGKVTFGRLKLPREHRFNAAPGERKARSGWLHIDGWHIQTVVPTTNLTEAGVVGGIYLPYKMSTRRCTGIVGVFSQQNKQIGWLAPRDIELISLNQTVWPANDGSGAVTANSPGLRSSDIDEHCAHEVSSKGGDRQPPDAELPLTAEVQTIPPAAFKAQRISGQDQIHPDDMTKLAMQKAGATRLIVNLKVCVSDTGSVNSVKLIGKGSGYPAYDAKIMDATRSWLYRPFVVNGTATPTCSLAQFIYFLAPASGG